MNHLKFLKEEMYHHDKEAKFYAKRNEKDYIWEIPAKKFLLTGDYLKMNDVVVDMGCGPSLLVKHILSEEMLRSIKYIGIDISKEMLKIAKKNIPNGKFIQGDMETAKLNRNSVDVIISLGALHHSQNKTHTLRNWFTLLKKGGYILMREPTKDALKRGQGESPNEEGIDIDEIILFANKNDGEIIKIYSFWSPIFHFINRVLIALGLGTWRRHKALWELMLSMDISVLKIGNYFTNKLKGDSVAIILQKK